MAATNVLLLYSSSFRYHVVGIGGHDQLEIFFLFLYFNIQYGTLHYGE